MMKHYKNQLEMRKGCKRNQGTMRSWRSWCNQDL